MNLRQQTFFDYDGLCEKFVPKKTTDDCYTPPNIWEAVRGWVFARYGLADDTPIVRPFWPDKDYEAEVYPDGCVVLDNPPFSIISKIVDYYQTHSVRFFLFAPYLTNIGIGRGTGCGHVIAPWSVRYENGAEVATSFVTNLDPEVVAEAAPELREKVRKADEANRKNGKTDLPVYSYPDAVVTSTALGYLAVHGTPLKIKRGDCAFIRKLDCQCDKAIFGGGLLLTERAAAERAAAERAAAYRWQLSDREKQMQRMIGGAF